MVLIQVVKEKDMSKVFSILLHNGRFSEIKGNKFRIDEDADNALSKIEKAEIEIKKF